MDLEVKASSACIELRMLKAACKCWCAIVRSEKTHTLARNQCQVLMGFCAIRKDTHAGSQRMPSSDGPLCGQKRVQHGSFHHVHRRNSHGGAQRAEKPHHATTELNSSAGGQKSHTRCGHTQQLRSGLFLDCGWHSDHQEHDVVVTTYRPKLWCCNYTVS